MKLYPNSPIGLHMKLFSDIMTMMLLGCIIVRLVISFVPASMGTSECMRSPNEQGTASCFP